MLRSRTAPGRGSGRYGRPPRRTTLRLDDRLPAASKRSASRKRFKRWEFPVGVGGAVLRRQRRRHHFRAFRRAEYNFRNKADARRCYIVRAS